MTLKLLIAEDARDVAEVVAFGARMTWPDCQVTIATSGEEALRRFFEELPDLVVLDVALPPPNGFEICRRIRTISRVPILILTVCDSTLDKVRALDLGADDYLTKPFDPLELLARLRALVRRDRREFASPGSLRAGDVTLDVVTHEVRVRGEVIRLTSTEYRLLEELVRHAGTVLPHHYLLTHVWGPAYGDAGYLKVFVRRLRHKLGDDVNHPHYIQTEWGIGYRFVAPSHRGASNSA
jgi:DNA-binding response OmpR family regulator